MTKERITRDGDMAGRENVSSIPNAPAAGAVEVNEDGNGYVKTERRAARVADVAGMLKTRLKLTIEEMDEKVAEAFRRGEL